MTTVTYLAASRSLLAQARAELDAGDLRQASEKGGGAGAQAVKSVVGGRGWEHRSHVALCQAVSRLSLEYGDDAIQRRFHVASSLRQSFYEDWMGDDNVRAALVDVADLVATLGDLRGKQQ